MRLHPGTRRKALSPDQAVFNCRLSRARGVVENTDGVLVACQRLFPKPIHAEKDNVACFPFAAVSLHSYLYQTERSLTILVGLWTQMQVETLDLLNGGILCVATQDTSRQWMDYEDIVSKILE